MSLKTNSKQPV